MKSTILLIAVNLFFQVFSFGQTVSNYGPFPKVSDDLFNSNFFTESYVLLEKSNQINTSTGDKKRINYHTFELQPNTTMLSKKINISSGAKSGVVLKSFLKDSYIIEFVGFMVVFNPNIDIGIVKRDRKTLEVVGEVKLLDEKLNFQNHHSNILETSDGYIFTRKVEDRYVVSYLDADFNELKKISLQEGISAASFKVNERNELFVLSVKFFKNNTYSHHFTIVNPSGEVLDVDPKMDLTESFGVRGQAINYLSDLEQIEGIFQYSMAPGVAGYDASKKEEGYKYYRWNLNGEILESKSHTFTVDEVYGDYKDHLLKNYSEKNLSDDLNSRRSSSNFLSSKDGSYLIIEHLTLLGPLQNSFHIVKMDKNGDFQWLKILPALLKNSVYNFDVLEDGNLRTILQDVNSTISNQKHQVKDITQKVDSEESSLFTIVIDKTSGEILEEKLIDLNLPVSSKIKRIDFNKSLNKYLIESVQNKLLTFSLISY